MTKKDYVKAAKIVIEMKRNQIQNVIDLLPYHAEIAFIRLFALDNPNFDETKFREACKGK